MRLTVLSPCTLIWSGMILDLDVDGWIREEGKMVSNSMLSIPTFEM